MGALSELQQQEVLEEVGRRRRVALSTAGVAGRGCALILVSKRGGKHVSRNQVFLKPAAVTHPCNGPSLK